MPGGSFIAPTTPKGGTAKLIPYSPQSEIYQYLRYNSAVNRTFDGDDFVQRNRQTPQRAYKYKYILSRDEAYKMEALLFNPELFYLPLWEQKQKYSGTVAIGSTYIQNAKGGFVAPDGVNQWVKIPITSLGNTFSIALTYKEVPEESSDHYIWLISDDLKTQLLVDYGTIQELVYKTTDSDHGFYDNVDIPYSTSWRTLVLTCNIPGTAYGIFHNGVADASVTQKTDPPQDLTFGYLKLFSGGDYPISGNFKNIIITSDVMDATDVSNYHTGIVASLEAIDNQVVWYKCDEASGDLADSSGNGNTGIVYNAASTFYNPDPDTLLDVDLYDLTANQFVLLYQSKTKYELMTISAIDSSIDKITFTAATTKEFVNPVIIPVYKALLLGTPEWRKKVGNDVFECELDFMLLSNITFGTHTPTETYGSIMVLAESNYYGNERTKSNVLDSRMIITDFNTGSIEYYKNDKQSVNIKTWGFYSQSRVNIVAMLNKLNYFNGQQRAVWIPTMQRDFEPQTNIGATDVTFNVNNKFLTEIYGADGLDRALMLWHNGTYYYRAFVSITETDDMTEAVEIDSAFGIDIDIANDSFFMCWIFKGCLSSDQLNIIYSNNQAWCKVSFKEVQA